MKLALVNGIKTEATEGVRGTCQGCGSEVISKCGPIKINHWAHKGIRNCDPWWENETEWHRAWKNNFPIEWQETPMMDDCTNERHIADIRTGHGLVIEFQHSHIHSEERTSRENFYKNMVWVVDGRRLKRDFSRFQQSQKRFLYFKDARLKGYFLVDSPKETFPVQWLDSTVPVIFDFRGSPEESESITSHDNTLWCLLPKKADKYAVIMAISSENFITTSQCQKELMATDELIRFFSDLLKPRQRPMNRPTKNSLFEIRGGKLKRKQRFR
ncbi:MAG: competence protein CoiA family protein [Allomuricauda sp.]